MQIKLIVVVVVAKAISSFMDSSKKKTITDKQTNKIWRIYWQLRLLSFWDVKGLLQTQKSQNLKNYYYANKFSNSTIAIRCQSSSNLFSCVIYYVIYLPLFEFLINFLTMLDPLNKLILMPRDF